MMAISPGEVLLPIYLSSAEEGLPVLIALTGAFLAGTLDPEYSRQLTEQLRQAGVPV